MAIGETVLALGIGATALAAGWGGFAVTVVVWTLGEIVTSIFRVPIVADISPDDMRGRYQGWFGFSFAVAFAIGPSLGLFVLDRLGTVLWWGAMVVALISAGWWLLLRSAIAERRAMSSGLGEGSI